MKHGTRVLLYLGQHQHCTQSKTIVFDFSPHLPFLSLLNHTKKGLCYCLIFCVRQMWCYLVCLTYFTSRQLDQHSCPNISMHFKTHIHLLNKLNKLIELRPDLKQFIEHSSNIIEELMWIHMSTATRMDCCCPSSNG